MHQSSTLYIGLDIHKESIAVAYVAKAHHAEVVSLGTIGTRQCDSDKLIRQLQSKSNHLVFVSEGRPLGVLALALSDQKRPCVLRRGPLLAPQKAWRSGQNQPPGCEHTGPPDALGGPHPGLRAPGGG